MPETGSRLRLGYWLSSEEHPPNALGGTIALGPDAKDYLDLIARYASAGFDHVLVHQIGPDQEGFLRFYADEILPALAGRPAARATA